MLFVDGETIIATARLTSVAYEQYMSDPNSEDYKKFCESVINEVMLFLSAATLNDAYLVLENFI